MQNSFRTAVTAATFALATTSAIVAMAAPPSGHQAPPPAPNPLHEAELSIVDQAGVGSDIAYARAGVIELGGGLSWTTSTPKSSFILTPQVGYFLLDNFQLSGLMRWTMAGSTVEAITALVEPSGHLPLWDTLFAFAGLGVGASYRHGAKTGFAVAPRVGLNVLVGRSGIFTPSFSYTLATNRSDLRAADGSRQLTSRNQFDINVGYAIMW